MPGKPYKTVTSINGNIVKRGQDKISVFDNSLLYAEGLFETFLAVEDTLVFAREHLTRLYKGAKVLGIKIPVDRKTLHTWMRKTIAAHPDKIKKLRLTVTSGEAARWVGVQGKQQVILSASPHAMPARPYKLHVSEFRVDQDSVFRQIKTLSYAIHAAALNQAKKAKYDDALLLNEKGQLAEVTSANIFWVKKNNIYTPPLSAGCLEGITRDSVIKETTRLGFNIIEQNGTLKKLFDADEVFISSSLKLVVGVSHIKTTDNVYRLKSGPVTPRIAHQYAAKVGLA